MSNKVSLVLRSENEHGVLEEVFLSKEGADLEVAERALVQEVFIDGAQQLVDAIYDLGEAKPKPKKTRAKRKAASKVYKEVNKNPIKGKANND